MRSNLRIYILILVLSLSILSCAPRAFAQDCTKDPKNANCYTLLAPLPLPPSIGTNIDAGNTTGTTTPNQYIKGIINLAVAVAGIIAVLKLVFAGFKYIATASEEGKGSSKKDIQNAVVGLILAIGAFTILNTIGTQFTQLTVAPDYVGSNTPLGNGSVCIGGTDAKGDCISTSTDPTDIPPCPNCQPVPSTIPHKTAAQKGCATDPCMINANDIPAMQLLADQLKGKVTWQITEMYPPTVAHLGGTNSCHDIGTCVDAAITPPAISAIATFLTTLEGINHISSYEYETCDTARLQQLQTAPELYNFRSKFKCESTTTGENIHINFSP